jgi:arylsulfatase A-like enzyme
MPDLEPDDNMADALTELAVHFIEKNKDGPFAFMLSHWAVHGPLQARPEEIERWKKVPTTDQSNPTYAAMVESVDRSVGTIVETLNRLGLTENTLVVFTSDNGGLTLRDTTSNYPLLGGKSFAYEAGMRVPFIVKWPARVKAGATTGTPVVGIDIFPTLFDCAGAADSLPEGIDGVSLKPLLVEGESLEERPLFFHFPHYTHATGPFSSVISNGWKLIRFYNDSTGAYQLFHLAEDPFEQSDLADANPEKLEELKAVLDNWLTSTEAQLPRPNPEFDPQLPPMKDKAFTWTLANEERAHFKQLLEQSTN